MELKIKTADGGTFTIHVSETCLTSEARPHIEQCTGIPCSSQRLIFQGRALEDSKTLAEQGVTENKTIHVVTRVPPPAPPTDGAGAPAAASESGSVPRGQGTEERAGERPPPGGPIPGAIPALQQFLSGMLGMMGGGGGGGGGAPTGSAGGTGPSADTGVGSGFSAGARAAAGGAGGVGGRPGSSTAPRQPFIERVLSSLEEHTAVGSSRSEGVASTTGEEEGRSGEATSGGDRSESGEARDAVHGVGTNLERACAVTRVMLERLEGIAGRLQTHESIEDAEERARLQQEYRDVIPQLRELSTLLGAFAAKLNCTTLGASPAEAHVAPAPFVSNIAVHVSSGDSQSALPSEVVQMLNAVGLGGSDGSTTGRADRGRGDGGGSASPATATDGPGESTRSDGASSTERSTSAHASSESGASSAGDRTRQQGVESTEADLETMLDAALADEAIAEQGELGRNEGRSGVQSACGGADASLDVLDLPDLDELEAAEAPAAKSPPMEMSLDDLPDPDVLEQQAESGGVEAGSSAPGALGTNELDGVDELLESVLEEAMEMESTASVPEGSAPCLSESFTPTTTWGKLARAVLGSLQTDDIRSLLNCRYERICDRAASLRQAVSSSFCGSHATDVQFDLVCGEIVASLDTGDLERCMASIPRGARKRCVKVLIMVLRERLPLFFRLLFRTSMSLATVDSFVSETAVDAMGELCAALNSDDTEAQGALGRILYMALKGALRTPPSEEDCIAFVRRVCKKALEDAANTRRNMRAIASGEDLLEVGGRDIERDSVRQQWHASQPPYSNAYRAGCHPSKRQKVVPSPTTLMNEALQAGTASLEGQVDAAGLQRLRDGARRLGRVFKQQLQRDLGHLIRDPGSDHCPKSDG